MGTDAVIIGLRHRLSVHNPEKIAKEISEKLCWNVKLVVLNEFQYDEQLHKISADCGETIVYEHKIDDTEKYLEMIMSYYQKREIKRKLGPERLQTLSYESQYVKEDFLDDEDDDGILYEVEAYGYQNTDDYIFFNIYEENTEIPFPIYERWHSFIWHFQNPETIGILKYYRQEVFKLAKIFGCESVIYCSDQTPSSRIWYNMGLPSSKLLEYAQSGAFLDDNGKTMCDKNTKKYARIIDFNSFLTGKERLAEKEFVEVVLDNFEGLEEKQLWDGIETEDRKKKS